uniref:SET domain-containing protein n=1 Tax=Glycine max TaxID=3847 RepID=A0A0R0J6Z8_SOYBN
MASVFSACSGSAVLFHSRNSFSSKGSFLHLKRPLSANCVASLGTEVSVSPAVDTFWQWLKEEGVVSGKTPVKPGVVPEGLGLVALKDISRNEVVLQVPKRLWINPDAVAASEIGKVCSGLKPWLAVALFLIRERSRSDSLWKHYFSILPKETDSTIYWSEEELSELQGTQLLNTTRSVKQYVQNEFRRLEEEIIIPNKKLFPSSITLDDFFWAFGILRSRAFSRLRNENLVVIPLADLVYIQYDLNKSNAELALDYGFIEPNTDRNAYTLTLQISESDPFFGDKLDIAESNGFGETAYFDIFYNRPLPPGLLPYLRLVALGGTDAFLLESIFRNSIWGHLELPVSRDNEELICRVVRETCKTALAGYHTTIEEV